MPKGWHSRGYLPHFDGGRILQTVTFHLADAYPRELIKQWKYELALLPKIEAERERRRRLQAHLDFGHGRAFMRDPELAQLVEDAMLFREGETHEMHAWVVMPNHVHALFQPLEELSTILKSWKSFTGREINKRTGHNGQVWFIESYDRYIRDGDHYENVVRYIEWNPVKARLCERPEDYRWSSANLGSP